LSQNKGKVFHSGIKNHEQTDPKRIPQKEKGGEKNNDPMSELCPTGFYQKGAKVPLASAPKLFFGKTQFPRKDRSVWQMFFPFPNFENLLVKAPLPLPISVSIKPAIWMKTVCWNPNRDSYHTHVNDEPSNAVDHNGPKGWEMDEPHEFNPSLSKSLPLFLSIVPFSQKRYAGAIAQK
jgi:hypothetical protein